jgi:hypothetical protein
VGALGGPALIEGERSGRRAIASPTGAQAATDLGEVRVAALMFREDLSDALAGQGAALNEFDGDVGDRLAVAHDERTGENNRAAARAAYKFPIAQHEAQRDLGFLVVPGAEVVREAERARPCTASRDRRHHAEDNVIAHGTVVRSNGLPGVGKVLRRAKLILGEHLGPPGRVGGTNDGDAVKGQPECDRRDCVRRFMKARPRVNRVHAPDRIKLDCGQPFEIRFSLGAPYRSRRTLGCDRIGRIDRTRKALILLDEHSHATPFVALRDSKRLVLLS